MSRSPGPGPGLGCRAPLHRALCAGSAGSRRVLHAHHEPNPRDDFTVREAMVPMRDGVKLFTLILTPKERSAPIPHPALSARPTMPVARCRPVRPGSWLRAASEAVGGGFIYVVQDIRGRFKSGGEFHMYRVPRGAFNKTTTDETTDAWDTIDWLVKNVAGHNGKVGIWGTSYPGWLVLAALRDPHPALAAGDPGQSVVDVWKADDWFHWGVPHRLRLRLHLRDGDAARHAGAVPGTRRAICIAGFCPLARRASGAAPRCPAQDNGARLLDQPSYGPYWRDCAADRWFDSPPRIVPTLHVHGLWDQGRHLRRARGLRCAGAPRPRQPSQLLCNGLIITAGTTTTAARWRAAFRRRYGQTLPARTC